MKNFWLFCVSVLSSIIFIAPNSNAQLSADYGSRKQGRIAFAYNNGTNEQLMVLDFGSRTLTPLLKDGFNNSEPAWSPDGTKLAFSSDRSGNKEIYIINSDGSGLQQLTKVSGDDEYPEWAPSGEEIVFSSERLKMGATLFLMKPDGSNQRTLVERPITPKRHQNLVPRWSPRNDEILFTTDVYFPGYDMVLFNLKSKALTPLTIGRGSYSRGNWSPDASEIIFTYGSADEADLWTIKKGSGIPTALTKLPGREYDAIWVAPETVFFVGEEKTGSKLFQLNEIDMTTKEIRQITSGEGSVRYPSWTPFTALPPLPVTAEAETKKE